MSGLTPTGFQTPTLQEVIDALAQDARDKFGAELDTGPESVLGQLIGIFAERVHELWIAERDVWQAFTPNGATGESLIQLSLITGTVKADATKSRVNATLNLDAGTTVLAGSRARVSTDETAVFELLADATNPGGSPANIDAVMQAVDAGPTRANAGTLTTIVTPTSGWNSVTNALDAEMGAAAETDAQLRTRREEELRVQGSSNLDAIVADARAVGGVIDAVGEENDTNGTVGGLPPHSFRIVVWDGDPAAADDDAIAQAIWDAKPVGISAEGATDGTATDLQGDPRTVAFDRADDLLVYLEFDIEIDPVTWPADGEDQVAEAVVAYADSRWRIGQDVILSALYGPVFSVSGLVRIAAVRAGTSPSPVGTVDLSVAADEIARADTARVLVTVV